MEHSRSRAAVDGHAQTQQQATTPSSVLIQCLCQWVLDNTKDHGLKLKHTHQSQNKHLLELLYGLSLPLTPCWLEGGRVHLLAPKCLLQRLLEAAPLRL